LAGAVFLDVRGLDVTPERPILPDSHERTGHFSRSTARAMLASRRLPNGRAAV